MTFKAMTTLCTLFCTLLNLVIQIGAQGYDPEASITGLYTGPYFDPLAARNFTAHLDDQAILPCTVRQLGDKSVSWVRMRDADILTVDRYTFVGDERFESHYSAPMETWNLVIKYVQERDAGLYECQVSTEPKMSQLFSLRVVIPKVTILPPGDRYVKAGSQVRIDCQITDVVQLPDYIFWYREDKRVMDHLDSNIVVTLQKTGIEAITSTLIVHKVPPHGSGNYTCMPSNLHSASVILHVLNEKHPAAMQGEFNGGSWQTEAQCRILVFLLLLVLLHRASYLNLNEGNNESTSEKQNPLDQAAASLSGKDTSQSLPSPFDSFTSPFISSYSASSLSRLPPSGTVYMDGTRVNKILMALKDDDWMTRGEGGPEKRVQRLYNPAEGDVQRKFPEAMERQSIISLSKVDLFFDPLPRVLEATFESRPLASVGDSGEGARVKTQHFVISTRWPLEIDAGNADINRYKEEKEEEKKEEEDDEVEWTQGMNKREEKELEEQGPFPRLSFTLYDECSLRRQQRRPSLVVNR